MYRTSWNFSKNIEVVIGVLGPFFMQHMKDQMLHIDQMSMCCNVHIVIATHRPNVNFSRRLGYSYIQPILQSMADSTKPHWCSTILAGVDLVWCMHNAYAPSPTTTFLACSSLEYGPWLSHSIWVCSRRKHQSVKQYSESEVPFK